MRAGWGGKRHGSGRKKKNGAAVLVHPSAREAVEAAAAAPVEDVPAPAELGPDELAIWILQAPQAMRAGTLTRATAIAFGRYCRVVVLERVEAEGGGAGGVNHRGLLKLLESAESRFGLVPMPGRPAAAPVAKAAPASLDPNDAYFAVGAAPRVRV